MAKSLLDISITCPQSRTPTQSRPSPNVQGNVMKGENRKQLDATSKNSFMQLELNFPLWENCPLSSLVCTRMCKKKRSFTNNFLPGNIKMSQASFLILSKRDSHLSFEITSAISLRFISEILFQAIRFCHLDCFYFYLQILLWYI